MRGEKREEKEQGKCPLSWFSPWKRERKKERKRERQRWKGEGKCK
jgi:hypothetical protein